MFILPGFIYLSRDCFGGKCKHHPRKSSGKMARMVEELEGNGQNVHSHLPGPGGHQFFQDSTRGEAICAADDEEDESDRECERGDAAAARRSLTAMMTFGPLPLEETTRKLMMKNPTLSRDAAKHKPTISTKNVVLEKSAQVRSSKHSYSSAGWPSVHIQS